MHDRTVEIENDLDHFGRPFSVLDAMILVAATAAGFSIMRVTWNSAYFEVYAQSDHDHWIPVVEYYSMGLSGVLTSLLTAWTPATLLIQLRPPRPSRQMFLRQPGVATCLVSLVMFPFALHLGYEVDSFDALNVMIKEHFSSFLAGCMGVLVDKTERFCGPAVIGSWVTMRLSPSASRKGWINHIGLAIGIGWIVVFLLAWFRGLVYRFSS